MKTKNYKENVARARFLSLKTQLFKEIFIRLTGRQTFILVVVGVFSFSLTNAQAPSIIWQKCFGGDKDDIGKAIIKLADGNYLSCGTTNSQDGDFNATHGNHDAFLMKTDPSGNIIWEQTYGGSHYDEFDDIIESSSGDLIAIGKTTSNDGQVSGNHGSADNYDIWLVRTDKNGTFQSQHCYGGSGDDEVGHMIMTAEGNIVFAGFTTSNDGNVSNNHGDYDGWVVKLKKSGHIDFSVTIGDTAYDVLKGITEINGSLIVVGTTSIHHSDFPDNELYYDAFAAKLDLFGNIIYSRKYGGSASDNCNDVVSSAEGNAVLVGHTNSEDGDDVGNSGWNMWMWKINASSGDIMWQNYSGVPADTLGGFGLFATSDGGFVSVGSVGQRLLAALNTADNYAVKVDASGNLLWTKQFGGGKYDALFSGVEAYDGSILMIGGTKSNNKDVSGNHGGHQDAWLADLSADEQRGLSTFQLKANNFSLVNFPNPFAESAAISFRLTSDERVLVEICDVEGRLIRMLANDAMNAGPHQVTWDARDEKGNEVSAGIYFLRIQSAGFSQTEKLIVIK